MTNYSLNQKLAFLALAISFVGLLLSFISPNGLDDVNEKPNYISVVGLAKKIKGRAPVNVIDIRSEELFEEFHLPTAKHIPLDRLLQLQQLPNDSIVFYSGDDPLTRDLWKQLPISVKQRSRILYGGIHDWYDRVLYPKLPLEVNEEDSALFKDIHGLSLFYGGQAEFVNDSKIMQYYKKNFSKMPWTKSDRQNGLVRKGC